METGKPYRPVIMFNMMSLDGFFEGPGHNIDWHNVDEEFNEFAIQQLDSAGALIFGRTTYELMASYWPSPAGIKDDPQVAQRMNRLPKIVFSHSLARAEWQNTRLVKSDPAAEIRRLQKEPGGSLFVFGSANLADTLMAQGLIDEFRILVNPLILGSGTPLFQGAAGRIPLRLASCRTFANGNVLLIYQRSAA
jgi:dihydrofolate reductase